MLLSSKISNFFKILIEEFWRLFADFCVGFNAILRCEGGVIGRRPPSHQACDHVLLVLCLLFSCRWPVEEISDSSGLELAPIARDLLIVQPYVFFLFLPLVLYLVLVDDGLHLLYHSTLFAVFAGIGGELL